MFYKALNRDWKDTASTGGIVRGCAHWLLENGHIKNIIGVLNGDTPGEFYWGITSDPRRLAKSVYKPLDLQPLAKTLTDDEKKEALFIGLPCQVINGTKYKITLCCSGSKRGDLDKTVIDFRYCHKPENYGVQYADGTFDWPSDVKVEKLKESCNHCTLTYTGDMIVGDVHGTPYNLVETLNPLFDEYIETTQHHKITETMFSILKLDN